jgi:hypothetical protein
MSAEQVRHVQELEGAQKPGEINDLLGYAREHGVSVHNLQQELGIGSHINLDQVLTERTSSVAIHIRPLVEAALAHAPIRPDASKGFASVRGLETTHLTDLLLERLQLDSLFADNPAGALNIHAITGRELPVALTYTFRAATAQNPKQFLYVMADPESGFVNLRARRGVSLLEGEANVVGVPGMLDTLMADVMLLPPVEGPEA